MGAEVFALTHSLKKKDDILKMGADHIIVTGEDEFETKHFRELDLILTTVDKVEGLPFGKLCKVRPSSPLLSSHFLLSSPSDVFVAGFLRFSRSEDDSSPLVSPTETPTSASPRRRS